MNRDRIHEAWVKKDLDTLLQLAFWEMQKCEHGMLTFYGPLPQYRGSWRTQCRRCQDARARGTCDHKQVRLWSYGGIAGDNYLCGCSATLKEQYEPE